MVVEQHWRSCNRCDTAVMYRRTFFETAPDEINEEFIGTSTDIGLFSNFPRKVRHCEGWCKQELSLESTDRISETETLDKPSWPCSVSA